MDSVSEDIGRLVTSLTDQAVRYASTDIVRPKKEVLDRYFETMHGLLCPVELYQNDKLVAEVARKDFYEVLPKFYDSFSNVLTELREQNQRSEDTFGGFTKTLATGTGIVSMYTIGAIATGMQSMQPPPFDDPTTTLFTGMSLAGLLALGAGISHSFRKKTSTNNEHMNNNSKTAASATADNWFNAFYKNQKDLRKNVAKYMLYARNGRHA